MPSVPEVTPQYLAEENGAPLLNVGIAFVVLNTVFTICFLVAKYLKKTLWKLDVCFVLVGFGWNLACAIMAILFLESPPKIVLWLKLELAVQYAYLYGVTFPKLAILHLYLRIFTVKIYRQITYVAAAIVILNAITLTIVGFAICRPFAFNWDKTISGGHCGDLYLLYKLASFPNIVTDVIILALPVPVIWRLNAKPAQKAGLTATFLTGSFGIVTAIIRLYHFFTTDLFSDITFNSVTTMSWTVVEPGCYLIAAILPSLRPFIGYISQSKLSTYFRSRFTSSSSRSTRQKSLPVAEKRQLGAITPTQRVVTRLDPPREAYSLDGSHENKITVTKEFIIQVNDY